MTGALLALALLGLPEGTARYRFELAGEHVGVVELAVRCAAGGCAASFAAERRAPAEAGGGRSSRRVTAEVDREGRWRGGALRVVEDGAAVGATGRRGAVPVVLAELALLAATAPDAGGGSARGPSEERCLAVFDERSGEAGEACGRREGEHLAATVRGAAELVALAPDGLPARVELPGQGARFVRDDAAALPAAPPRLHGTRVPGPADPAHARSFCGVPRDPEARLLDPSRLPPPRAEGASCRERTAAWLARARAAGLGGRTAVGVAWDGGGFAWHAWAEVLLDGAWTPVDPSFGELPARGPRFTLAAYDEADEAARRRAGERILACWAGARVR